MTYPLIESVGVVVFNKDKVLLVRHGKASNYSDSICGIPAGKIEKGETGIQAAKRELEEEAGLKCILDNLITMSKSYRAQIKQKDGIKIFNWYVFYCKKYTGEIRTTDETHPFWLPIKDLEKYKLLPNVQNAVTEALAI